jgi:hypothetical protein
VKLTIPLGEPGSKSSFANSQIPFKPTGFPTCTADLRAQAVRCSGLVAGARYRLTRARAGATVSAAANKKGDVAFRGFGGARAVRGGDVMTLRNRAARTLTVLHVAHLRVDITAQQTVIASGTCEPGEYYGPPVKTIPSSLGVGAGLGGTGKICAGNGSAAGFSAADIAQTDDRSGGQTLTEVPDLVRTTPTDGETLYGPFIALASTGLPGQHGAVNATGAAVSLTISSGHHTVLHAANVATAHGVVVKGLTSGAYSAKWVLTDANGDTRTVQTQFVEAP